MLVLVFYGITHKTLYILPVREKQKSEWMILIYEKKEGQENSFISVNNLIQRKFLL